MSGLGLVPNELVGYRIKPDWYSYNVVIVKRHGANSRNAGQEYETPLAYCKSLKSAAEWIFSHAVRVQGELNQAERRALEGSVAEAKALLASYEKASEHVMRAVDELAQRIESLGVSQKELVRAYHAQAGTSADE